MNWLATKYAISEVWRWLQCRVWHDWFTLERNGVKRKRCRRCHRERPI